MFKYWAQRYRLFSKFDSGIKLDKGRCGKKLHYAIENIWPGIMKALSLPFCTLVLLVVLEELFNQVNILVMIYHLFNYYLVIRNSVDRLWMLRYDWL